MEVGGWGWVFNRPLLDQLTLPLTIIFSVALGTTCFFYKKQKSKNLYKENLPLDAPLNIKDTVFFGFLYTGILMIVSYASCEYGTKGINFSSAISALTDIDAITISVSKLGGKSINFLTAQNAILLATLANTIVKIGIALYLGSNQIKRYIILGYGVIFIAGIIGFLFLNL